MNRNFLHRQYSWTYGILIVFLWPIYLERWGMLLLPSLIFIVFQSHTILMLYPIKFVRVGNMHAKKHFLQKHSLSFTNTQFHSSLLKAFCFEGTFSIFSFRSKLWKVQNSKNHYFMRWCRIVWRQYLVFMLSHFLNPLVPKWLHDFWKQKCKNMFIVLLKKVKPWLKYQRALRRIMDSVWF